MRKPLGRLAAVVLAGALLTFAAAPAAIADEPEVSTTTAAAAETTSETSAPATSTTSSTETSTTSETTTSSSSIETTTTKPDTSSSTSAPTSSEPAETSDSSTAGWPPDPYEDDKGYGIDLGNGQVAVIIACAAGEPKDLFSPQFDILDGPYQEEQDGRYWDYLVQLHDGVSPGESLEGSWTCGGTPQGGTPQGGNASGGGVIAPAASSSDAGAWQAANGGDAQVRYAPKEGVETGFGGTAQG